MARCWPSSPSRWRRAPPPTSPHDRLLRAALGYRDRSLGGPLDGAWGPGTVVLTGANGCGKSTFLRTLAGIIAPLAGRVTIAGHDLVRHEVAAKRALGWMPDRLPVPGETLAGELLDLVCWAKGLPTSAARDAGLQELGVPPLLAMPLGTCSLGQQRRVCLVAALIGDPQVLLLDEPDRGLDAEGMAVLLALLARRKAAGRTTMLSSHDPRLQQDALVVRFPLGTAAC